jgi:hypothetical protein
LYTVECVWEVEDVIDAADMQTPIRRSQDEDGERKPEREERERAHPSSDDETILATQLASPTHMKKVMSRGTGRSARKEDGAGRGRHLPKKYKAI